MTQQIFAVGDMPQVAISQISGEVEIEVWDERAIGVETDVALREIYQEGDTLRISGCASDLTLRVPSDCAISAEHVQGDVEIEGVRRVELAHIQGDVELEDISEAVDVADLKADIEISRAAALHARDGIGGDAEIEGVAQVEIEQVGGDVSVEEAQQVLVGSVGGDLDVETVAASLRCGNVGGDCTIQDSAEADVVLGNIGSDLDMDGAKRLQAGSVGSDVDVRNISGDAEIGMVGSNLDLVHIGGNVQIGQVGSDATLKNLRGNIEVGAVGSDLELEATLPPDSHARLHVGGDADITLPATPNLSLQAAVGGSVSGSAVAASGSGNQINLVYGEGAARLTLHVGGDLNLRGGGSPHSSSSRSWSEFSAEFGDFGREMAELGRELGRLGQEIGREIADAFSETAWKKGAKTTDDVGRTIEEKIRRVQQRVEERARRHAKRATERAQRHEKRAQRVHVRINEREWQFDPERLERIKEQARRAAAEGLSGALETVERAISKMRVPEPPPRQPHTPPPPPSPPEPPHAATGQTIRIRVEEEPNAAAEQQHTSGDAAAVAPDAPAKPPMSPTDIERERETILRMIAEGRITPEEGDLLLESLGS
jgi:hypothetical protein